MAPGSAGVKPGGPEMPTHPALARLVLPVLLASSFATSAHAQQPLDQFLGAVDDANLDVRVARALLSQARSQADEARARLLPNANAVGTYTRNENEVAIQIPDPDLGTVREATFQPNDQFDARFTIAAPILDLSAW